MLAARIVQGRAVGHLRVLAPPPGGTWNVQNLVAVRGEVAGNSSAQSWILVVRHDAGTVFFEQISAIVPFQCKLGMGVVGVTTIGLLGVIANVGAIETLTRITGHGNAALVGPSLHNQFVFIGASFITEKMVVRVWLDETCVEDRCAVGIVEPATIVLGVHVEARALLMAGTMVFTSLTWDTQGKLVIGIVVAARSKIKITVTRINGNTGDFQVAQR